MESLLNRYRNITVLLLVIMAQLVLLAVSAKNDQDVRFIRIWTVTAVTPVARIIEGLRGGGTGFLHNYILLHDTNQENRRLRAELDRMKMENVFLKNELNTADRAKALQVFQQHTPSKTVAATIIATGAGSNSKVVFVDRGTVSGVQRGMAVVTPDGIVGKVIAAYPTASQVLLITDPDFAAGVVTEKSQVHGTLKGQGTPQCKVDYVAFEEKVEPGEWVYTSGDDRIFPRGFRVGIVKAVRPGQPFKEILVEPSGMQRGLVEDVLILIEGVHQRIPDAPSGMQPIYIAAPRRATSPSPPPRRCRLPWGPRPTACARSIRRSARNRSTRTAKIRRAPSPPTSPGWRTREPRARGGTLWVRPGRIRLHPRARRQIRGPERIRLRRARRPLRLPPRRQRPGPPGAGGRQEYRSTRRQPPMRGPERITAFAGRAARCAPAAPARTGGRDRRRPAKSAVHPGHAPSGRKEYRPPGAPPVALPPRRRKPEPGAQGALPGAPRPPGTPAAPPILPMPRGA